MHADAPLPPYIKKQGNPLPPPTPPHPALYMYIVLSNVDRDVDAHGLAMPHATALPVCNVWYILCNTTVSCVIDCTCVIGLHMCVTHVRDFSCNYVRNSRDTLTVG